MSKILLVEDSLEIYTLVKQALGQISDLVWAKNISEARKYVSESKFEVILLDIELPDGSGIDFCSEINTNNINQSIFFLTSHSTLSEKVLGFTAGADDYITKPFQLLEFKARVESKLKKIHAMSNMSNTLKLKMIEIDKNKQQVKVLKNEQFNEVELTYLEFKLLTYLSDRADNVIPRDEILNEIWGEDVHVYSRSVDTHISKLRKKLGPASDYIKSIHGTGYKFSED